MKFRMQLKNMVASDRDEAVADMIAELSDLKVIDVAVTGTSTAIPMAQKTEGFEKAIKETIAKQLGFFLLDCGVIDFTRTENDNLVEITGALKVVREDQGKLQ
jgi:hypothetical protein